MCKIHFSCEHCISEDGSIAPFSVSEAATAQPDIYTLWSETGKVSDSNQTSFTNVIFILMHTEHNHFSFICTFTLKNKSELLVLYNSTSLKQTFLLFTEAHYSVSLTLITKKYYNIYIKSEMGCGCATGISNYICSTGISNYTCDTIYCI